MNRTLSIVGLLLFFCAWEISSNVFSSMELFFPALSTVIREGSLVLSESRFWELFLRSTVHYILGVIVGCTLGTIFGTAWVEMPKLRALLYYPVRIIRPIPPLAWVPLAIVWFGLSTSTAAFIIGIGVFWIMFDGTRTGLDSVDERYLELAKCFNRNALSERLWHVTFPAAAPTILSSLRSSLAMGWMLLVAAEISGVPGIGQYMWEAAGVMATDRVVLCMLTISLLYSCVDLAAARGERKIVWWINE